MGTVALAAGALLAIVTVLVDTFVADGDGEGSPSRPARALLLLAAASLLAATVRLAVALLHNDFSYAYVAATSRRGASPGVRLSGLWGGAEGSLLLFTTMLAVAVAVVPNPIHRRARSLAALVIASFATATLFAAFPFERLALAPLSGRGIAPILEHPAMLIHPPLLYLGTVLALLPALCADPQRARRLAIAAWTTITIALALGASWAYVELGWGGWWAWDPVENVALIPWLLLAAALHAPPASRTATATYAVLWPLVMAGTAMTRTSLRTSVHAFADAASLRWWLWPTAVVAAAAAAVVAMAALRVQRPAPRDRRAVARVTLGLSAAIVALGTFRPLVPGDATAGWFYTTMLFPLTLVGALAVGVAPRVGRTATRTLVGQVAIGSVAGATFTAAAGAHAWNQLLLAAALGGGLLSLVAGRRRHIAMILGHLGMVCVVAGALAGTTGTSRTVELATGTQAEIEGHIVENVAVTASASSAAVPEITATVLVDRRSLAAPSIAVFADRALRLPEVATVATWTSDVQVILRSADDDQSIVITVNVYPLIRLVWLGAGLLAASGFVMLVDRRYRRSRFDRSSSSTVDNGVAGSSGSLGGSGGGAGLAGSASARGDAGPFG